MRSQGCDTHQGLDVGSCVLGWPPQTSDFAFKPQACHLLLVRLLQSSWVIPTKAFELILKKEPLVSPRSRLPDRFIRKASLGQGDKVVGETTYV